MFRPCFFAALVLIAVDVSLAVISRGMTSGQAFGEMSKYPACDGFTKKIPVDWTAAPDGKCKRCDIPKQICMEDVSNIERMLLKGGKFECRRVPTGCYKSASSGTGRGGSSGGGGSGSVGTTTRSTTKATTAKARSVTCSSRNKLTKKKANSRGRICQYHCNGRTNKGKLRCYTPKSGGREGCVCRRRYFRRTNDKDSRCVRWWSCPSRPVKAKTTRRPPATTPASSTDVCKLKKNVGKACPGGKPRSSYRFYWTGKKCTYFRYKGCGGNGNNFKSAPGKNFWNGRTVCNKACKK